MTEKTSFDPSIEQVEYTNTQLYSKEKDLQDELVLANENEQYFDEEDDEEFSEGLYVETGSGLAYEKVGEVERRIEGNRNIVKAFYEVNKDRLHAIALEEDARRSHEVAAEDSPE